MKKNKILILLVIGLSLGSCVQTDDEVFSPEPTEILNEDDLHLGGYPLPRSVIFGINLTF